VEFIPMLALGALVFTVVMFLKNLSAQQWRPAATQIVAWACGVAGVFVMAATQFAGGISVGSLMLDQLDGWSKVLIGLFAASMISIVNEFKKAIDRNDTAAVPEWFEAKEEAIAHTHIMLPAPRKDMSAARHLPETSKA
jgi:hypothetical protein